MALLRTVLTAMMLCATVVFAAVGAAGDRAPSALTIQGESAVRTNIGVGWHTKAAGGAYLALNTAQAPPGHGWYATYKVRTRAAGVYRLEVVATPPAMPDRTPVGGSYFEVSVNAGPSTQAAKSEPLWARTPQAWGALVRARLDDVELRRGVNTITFRVRHRRTSAAPARYVFSLDQFTVAPTKIAVAGVSLGDPSTGLGVYRDGPAIVRVRLNGRTPKAKRVRYRVTDYFAREVASGTVTIPAGARAGSVRMPELPPGNYRATATSAVGYFARLPRRKAVEGPANRFAVTTSAPWLIPSSRLTAVSTALKEAGAGYVRDEISWPLIEPARGRYDTAALDGIAREFRGKGVKTLGAWWSLPGNNEAPRWAMTKDSMPLPADLRDAYNTAHHLAGRADGVGGDALEVWNEPDVDVIRGEYSRSTGDQHAAYVKAATLGITDRPVRPLAALSGVAEPGPFQDVMLQNDVARYADVWSFHGYASRYRPSGLSAASPFPATERRLRELYDARAQLWMTEAGIFIEGKPRPRDQARYLVQSAVQDLAAGTDKHFWFTGTPYCASGYACFGLLNEDFQPWPSYSAYAAMTSTLGQANYAGRVHGLPANSYGYVFENAGKAVSVIWAAKPTQVKVPVRGGKIEVYDLMGARRPAPPVVGGNVRVRASLDPMFVVSDGGGLRARPPADDRRRTRAGRLSEAEHIVVSQRFGAKAAPEPAPYGYRLGRRTRMSVEVYNFNATPKVVTLSARSYGGWRIVPARRSAVRVPARGRVHVPFTITAGAKVRPGVDYPLVFGTTLGGHRVPPSVSRINLRASGRSGKPLPLAPSIRAVSPVPGATVTGPRVRLSALVTDAVSGVDPGRVTVEVDGTRVPSRLDPATGRLSAWLYLTPGRHTVRIRAFNNAHAPAMTIAVLSRRPPPP